MEERHKILSSIRNPLSVIALFVLFVEIIASFTLINSSLTDGQRWCFVIFCIVFPFLLLLLFFFLVWYHPEHFYAPSDYSDDKSFLKAMKIGKIEDEVDEIVQTAEGTDVPESRMQIIGQVANAERLVLDQLLKEYNCPISQQVLSDDNTYLYDAIIHKGRSWIYVEVKYVRKLYPTPRFLDQIRQFAHAVGNNSKLLAIVTPEVLNENKRAKFREKIDVVDKTMELRFYNL